MHTAKKSSGGGPLDPLQTKLFQILLYTKILLKITIKTFKQLNSYIMC